MRFHHGHFRGGGSDASLSQITPDSIRAFGRLLAYLKPHVWKVVVLVLLTVTMTGIGLIFPQLMRLLLDKVVYGDDPGMLRLIVTVFIGTAVLRAGFGYTHAYLGQQVGHSIVLTLRNQLYEQLQRLSLPFFESQETGSIMSRVVNDTEVVQRSVVNTAETIINSVLTLVGVTVILFATNSTLAFYTLIPVPVFIAAAVFYSKMLKPRFRQVREKVAALNAFVQERIAGVRIVKAFASEDPEQAQFEQRTGELYGAQMKAAALFASIMPVMSTASSLGLLMVLFVGGRMAVQGRISGAADAFSGGDLVSFAMYLNIFYRPIRDISHLIGQQIPRALAAAERIFEFMDETQKLPVPADAVVPDHIRGEIVMEGVTFSYGNDDVLKDVTLTVKSGETVALVGPSGAGKTTLTDLISRFYEVERGSVYVDGLPVKQYDPRGLRKHIGLVLQEPFLFNASVRDNIAYGRPGATEDEIRAAAVKAEADDFIRDLPKGYDTVVGERGVKLSVGQKQRISIARALLKDPAILILDEATSSVDTVTEKAIQRALEAAARDRTTILIAHRLSTTYFADRILVLDEGRIVEEGGVHELLETGGLFAKLYQMQTLESTLGG